MKKIYKKYSLLFLVFFLSVTKVTAQYIPGEITNPLRPDMDSIPAILTELFGAISKIGAILLAIMIVYSGFLFVTAAGNDTRLTKAKESIKYVIIGGAVVLGATGIAELIEQTLTVAPVP